MEPGTEVALFTRKPHQAWLYVEPGSPTGRRIYPAFTLIPEEGNIMSTATLQSNVVDLEVRRANKEKMGLLLAARARIRQARDMAISLPKAAWNWIVEKFHLGSVKALITDIVGWVKPKIVSVLNFLGRGGLVGAGIIALSTEQGQATIRNVVGRPLAFIGRMASKAWNGAQNLLCELGRPGQWVANRMNDAETFLTGDGKDNTGILGRTFGKVAGFFTKRVLPHLHPDSNTMMATTVVGAALVAAPMVPFIGFGWVGTAAAAGVALMGAVAARPAQTLVSKAGARVGLFKNQYSKVEDAPGAQPAPSTEQVREAAVKVTTTTTKQHGPAKKTGNRRR